ncbi:MAG: PIG-L family deacetylase [Lentisphaeria bacterium]|nr:PIG-L family deacetylase [Lentisphaeria bacterium]
MSGKRLALVGAHPDDCDILASGLAMRYRELGWDVLFVSMANGDCGHQEMDRAELGARRAGETAAVAEMLGIEYVVMDVPDCEVQPTLEQRWALLRLLRRFAPDLVVTHHQQDYHPDHRYTSQLVGDVSFLLKVPHCCPDTPALRKDTVHAFFHAVRASDREDAFAVAVPIDDLWRRKLEVMACHTSQMFEWLPWVNGEDMRDIPPASDAEGRLAFIDERRRPIFTLAADLYRDRLVELLGAERARSVKLAEVYYAAPFPTSLSERNYRVLFPFLC